MKPGDRITWVRLAGGGQLLLRVLMRSYVIDLPGGFILVGATDEATTGLSPEDEGIKWHAGHDDPVADAALLAAHALDNT